MSPAAPASRAARWLESWPPLRRLDRVPFGRALFFGLALGLAVGTGLLGLPDGMRLAVAVVVIALAGAVAWSGQPVGIWEEVMEETEPLLDMVAIEGGRFLMGSPFYEIGGGSSICTAMCGNGAGTPSRATSRVPPRTLAGPRRPVLRG